MKNMARKDLREYADHRGKKLIRAGYCELQYSTKFAIELGHNYGIYGWNWTAYEFDTCIICTGYRNLTGKPIDHQLAKCCEEYIKDLMHNQHMVVEELEKRAKIYISSYIEEA